MPTTSAPRNSTANDIETKKLLVERLASSNYLSKSTRLRDMFLYLCERVLDHGVEVIHEHEVGHKVFGRPLDYDTNADNIVRVHASTLRKRIEQYFANEGSQEAVIIEIPRGNYAPVFSKRPAVIPGTPPPSVFEATQIALPEPATPSDWKLGLLFAVAIVCFCSTAYLSLRMRALKQAVAPAAPSSAAVRTLWSDIFASNKPSDIVLDDAALAFFQELTGRRIPLSEYFDRSYLRSVEQSATKGNISPEVAEALVLKRQSSYANASLLWKLGQISESLRCVPKVHFARDYSFRELKADNAVLLGNSRSNPWIEPFESHMSLRWQFDNSLGTYYPVDSSGKSGDATRYQATANGSDSREGYATVSLLPNLSGTGKILIISATGGAAMSSALDFLADEHSLSKLRSLLPKTAATDFPFFEALLRVKSRNSLPRDAEIIICHPPKP